MDAAYAEDVLQKEKRREDIMGSIKPNGDKVGGLDNAVMFVSDKHIVIEFEREIVTFAITFLQAAELHRKLGEAIEVLRDEISDGQLPQSSTDT